MGDPEQRPATQPAGLRPVRSTCISKPKAAHRSMPKKPRIVIKHVIVCDDVRRENNGKFILIGVYSNEISFARLPTQFEFVLWVEMDQKESGNTSLQMRCIMKSPEHELFSITMDMKIDEPGHNVAIAIGQIGVLFSTEGTLSIQFRQNEEGWKEFRALPVRQAKASASVQQRPA
jgi:hypothetical protein